MRLIIHQVAKDVRLLRWPIAAWVLVLGAFHAIAIAVLRAPRVSPEVLQSLATIETTLTVVGTAAFIVIAAMLVHADSPCTTTAFWLTRPVSGGAMACAKLLAVMLVLYAIAALGNAFEVLAAGSPAPVLVAARPLVPLIWLLPILALAAVTVDLAQFVLFAVLEIVLFIATFTAVGAFSPQMAGPPDFTWFFGILLALTLAVVLHQYLARRTRISLVVCALVPFALLASVPRRGTRVELQWNGAQSVSVVADLASAVVDRSPSAHVLRLPLRVDGVPDGTEVDATAAGASLDVDGEILPLGRLNVGGLSNVASRWPTEAERRDRVAHVLAPVLGTAQLVNPRQAPVHFPEIRVVIPDSLLERVAARTCTLRLVVRFSAQNYRVVSATAAAEGARFRTGSTAGRLLDVRPAGNRASMRLSEVSAAWNPFGGWSTGDLLRSAFVLLRNDSLHQAILPRPVGPGAAFNYGPPMLPVAQTLQVRWSGLEFDWGDNDVPAARWIEHAQLVMVGVEYAGRFTKTIDVPRLWFPERAMRGGGR